jgi:phosphoglycolate phosphatase-like HAD superfamily hydrolase
MLVLFDIDGTLLHSLSAGVHAMTSTLRELHGIEPDFKQIEIHGRLDTLIWRDLSKIHGYPTDDASHANFRRTYGEHLDRRLAENNTVQRYPGAKELVDATLVVPGLTIGLLTGNYEHTGHLKVRHAGIDPRHFIVNAWGDDGHDRRSLVPVAMRRYQELHGRPVAPQDVVIIGDTPADVDCAHASGARVIAVATGHFTVDQLRAAGGDLVVADLSDTEALVRWIVRAG